MNSAAVLTFNYERDALPSVSAATPATSKAKNMLDNIGAGFGKLPDERTRKRMAAFVDTLPPAG